MTLPYRVDGDHWSSCRGGRQGRAAVATAVLRLALSLIGWVYGLAIEFSRDFFVDGTPRVDFGGF